MSDAAENRFCFIAIVRDESPVIERCLRSIADIATSYLICDTGSIDDTVAKVRRGMEELRIPGAVIHLEWRNYGFNKTYLLEQVRVHPETRACRYIIWHDADEVFLTDPAQPDSYLTRADADQLYALLEARREDIFSFTTLHGVNAVIRYERWQIARNNQAYRWEMPFHEYFVGAERNAVFHIDKFYNLWRKEGNSSRDPARDLKGIAWLEEYLREHPREPRATFYLAQTERDCGFRDKAITHYTERANLEAGYDQERYLSWLYLARMATTEREKMHALWSAIDLLPERVEAIYELMMIYHNKRDHKKAAAIGALYGGSDKGMFLERAIYDYLFELNYSVSCHYAGEYERAYRIGRELFAKKRYPPELDEQIRKNLEFFVAKCDRAALALGRAPTVVIVDDYYPDPDAMRRFALAQEFAVSGNYPGMRTKSFATDEDRRKFESILGRKITYFPEGYNGSFQIVTGDLKSWIHRDLTRYGAVAFLSPNPPVNSGTILYRHRATGLLRARTKEEEDLLNLDANDESKWEVIDRIGNKYNRLVLFDGFLSHKSDTYFGSDKESGRLFQTFFFDVEPDQDR